jgi:uncharacterized protein
LNISKDISEKISCIDWQKVIEEMNENGYGLVLRLLPGQCCEELISKYDNSDLYRKTITMERHSFGLGEYKYFKYPLLDLIQTVRKEIYPKLVPVANTWMKVLDIQREFPNQFDEFQRLCHDKNQSKPILKYGKGGYNTLHQD